MLVMIGTDCIGSCKSNYLYDHDHNRLIAYVIVNPTIIRRPPQLIIRHVLMESVVKVVRLTVDLIRRSITLVLDVV